MLWEYRMFRKKEDDTIGELSTMVLENDNEQQNRVDTNGGDMNNRTPVMGRAPATPAPAAAMAGGYRPAIGGGASPIRTAGAPAPRPAGSSIENAIKNAVGEDLRQSPANMASKGNKRVLTVGNDILLKGEIATCDRLVIEGMVDATLKDVHTVEISESGSFKGTAEIQDAEISGLFEGNLIVRNRLTIYSTGKVRGTISYGEIEIERGGQMTGEIKISGDAEKNGKKAAA
jgi:cytoskeletal protein CcmA (bactofilin family)